MDATATIRLAEAQDLDQLADLLISTGNSMNARRISVLRKIGLRTILSGGDQRSSPQMMALNCLALRNCIRRSAPWISLNTMCCTTCS